MGIVGDRISFEGWNSADKYKALLHSLPQQVKVADGKCIKVFGTKLNSPFVGPVPIA